jgi:hypothetical protein
MIFKENSCLGTEKHNDWKTQGYHPTASHMDIKKEEDQNKKMDGRNKESLECKGTVRRTMERQRNGN